MPGRILVALCGPGEGGGEVKGTLEPASQGFLRTPQLFQPEAKKSDRQTLRSYVLFAYKERR